MGVSKNEQGQLIGKCDYCKRVFLLSRKAKWKTNYTCPLCEYEAKQAMRKQRKRGKKT